ncbi:MAG: dipeptidase PepV [Bacillota bacterium]|nr:dipeptidase PepV [Bacillota bacterium]
MDLNGLVDGYRDDIIRSTQEIIRIKSVEEEPREGMPFGKGPNDALVYYLELAREMGFAAKNVDGYAGHVEYGEGDEIIGVLVHLDIVPEGEGWTYPPYSGHINDNRIYGRGTVDDKGPAISVLYGLKAIKDAGIKPGKRIRIIAGLDEESGWECMEHYFKHEEKPVAGFSPDAEFPIINSEKGILIFKMRKTFDRDKKGTGFIKSITGGNRPNMVPDRCEALLETSGMLTPDRIRDSLESFTKKTGYSMEFSQSNGEVLIKSFGVSAHGSTPEKGQNAISQMLGFLSELAVGDSDAESFIRFMAEKIGMEYYGESMGVGFEDEVSGKLIFNLGEIKLDGSEGELVINIRYPIMYNREQVIGGLEKTLEGTGIEITDVSDKKPLYVPEDNFMVRKLKEVYKEITGEEATLISIGGGTYARAIDNAVAFGPLFPGQPELAHQKDEYIDIDDLMTITKIYAKAMYLLAE